MIPHPLNAAKYSQDVRNQVARFLEILQHGSSERHLIIETALGVTETRVEATMPSPITRIRGPEDPYDPSGVRTEVVSRFSLSMRIRSPGSVNLVYPRLLYYLPGPNRPGIQRAVDCELSVIDILRVSMGQGLISDMPQRDLDNLIVFLDGLDPGAMAICNALLRGSHMRGVSVRGEYDERMAESSFTIGGIHICLNDIEEPFWWLEEDDGSYTTEGDVAAVLDSFSPWTLPRPVSGNPPIAPVSSSKKLEIKPVIEEPPRERIVRSSQARRLNRHNRKD